jgi:hypothetical protein
MNSYIVVFEWPAAAEIAPHARRFEAESSDDAKMQAAVMYGCEPFEHGVPCRYAVFDGRGELVFRYSGAR